MRIELASGDGRMGDAMDPEGRERMISCGAALHHLKLALKHFGCLGRVELFPDLDQPTLAARIHIGSGRKRDVRENHLFAAMTKKLPAGESPISETTLAMLGGVVTGERGWVEFARSESSWKRLLEFAGSSERRRLGADAFGDTALLPAGQRGATARTDARIGTVSGWRVSRWTRPLRAFTVRRGDPTNLPVQPSRELAIPAGTLAVVKTKTDDKHGWLAAGHAMAGVVLQAQALGVSWSLFNEPVRRRTAREALRTAFGHKGFAQVVLRFGRLLTGETAHPSTQQTVTATSR